MWFFLDTKVDSQTGLDQLIPVSGDSDSLDSKKHDNESLNNDKRQLAGSINSLLSTGMSNLIHSVIL